MKIRKDRHKVPTMRWYQKYLTTKKNLNNIKIAICSEHLDNYVYFISQRMSNWKLSLIGGFNWESKILILSIIIFSIFIDILNWIKIQLYYFLLFLSSLSFIQPLQCPLLLFCKWMFSFLLLLLHMYMHKYRAYKWNLLSLFFFNTSLNISPFIVYKDSHYINNFYSLSTYIYVLSEPDSTAKSKEMQRSPGYDNSQSTVCTYSILLFILIF